VPGRAAIVPQSGTARQPAWPARHGGVAAAQRPAGGARDSRHRSGRHGTWEADSAGGRGPRPERRTDMSWKRFGIGMVLADFAALPAYAVYQHGLLGAVDLMMANSVTVALLVDLT